MVRPTEDWVNLLVSLSGLQVDAVRAMLGDLTFGSIVPLDIYIHPFVPSLDDRALFLLPHVILNSRAEENILRVCSYVRPNYYSSIQNAKEGEMRESIRANVLPLDIRYLAR